MSSNTSLTVKANRLILDFGCGEGRRWDGTFHEVVGIDISLKRLKIAKRRFPVVQCDGKLLPFRDSMFSSIVCFSVLEHIKNHQTALSEMTRVLATGGICRVSQPVDNDPIFIIARRVVKNWQGDAILSHFSTSQLLGQIRTRMRVTNILYTSNAPISGVFSFFGRKTPRMLRKIDRVYDLACKTTHMFHWQVDIVAVKTEGGNRLTGELRSRTLCLHPIMMVWPKLSRKEELLVSVLYSKHSPIVGTNEFFIKTQRVK